MQSAAERTAGSPWGLIRNTKLFLNLQAFPFRAKVQGKTHQNTEKVGKTIQSTAVFSDAGSIENRQENFDAVLQNQPLLIHLISLLQGVLLADNDVSLFRRRDFPLSRPFNYVDNSRWLFLRFAQDKHFIQIA